VAAEEHERAQELEDGVDRPLGRRRLLAGGIGVAIAGLVAKARPGTARAEDVPPTQALILGQENESAWPTGLTQDAPTPALSVRNPSGPGVVGSSLPATRVITWTGLAAGVTGVGSQIGVVGSSSLPRTVHISIPGTGVLGTGDRLGVVGSALPAARHITDPGFLSGAGVAGLGEQIGVVGSTSLPRTAQISATATGVVGTGDRLGIVGSALPASRHISTMFFPSSTGVVGLGDRLGVVGSALPGIRHITDVFVPPPGTGVAGLGERLGVVGSAMPAGVQISLVHDGPAGVLGAARGADAIGVVAENPDGVALRVVGRIALSSGGTGIVPARSRRVEIPVPSLEEGAPVNVTLMDDPGAPGCTLHYARAQAGSLVVALTAPAQQDTRFSYLVFA
jgi:hypothetical protein